MYFRTGIPKTLIKFLSKVIVLIFLDSIPTGRTVVPRRTPCGIRIFPLKHEFFNRCVNALIEEIANIAINVIIFSAQIIFYCMLFACDTIKK